MSCYRFLVGEDPMLRVLAAALLVVALAGDTSSALPRKKHKPRRPSSPPLAQQSRNIRKNDTGTLTVTTASPQARELYEAGITAWENLQTGRALDDWRQAVHLDPDFAAAHTLLSYTTLDPVEILCLRYMHVSIAVALRLIDWPCIAVPDAMVVPLNTAATVGTVALTVVVPGIAQVAVPFTAIVATFAFEDIHLRPSAGVSMWVVLLSNVPIAVNTTPVVKPLIIEVPVDRAVAIAGLTARLISLG
jgi:hypothetical protein